MPILLQVEGNRISSRILSVVSQSDGFVINVSQATLPQKVFVVLLSLSCKFNFSIFYQTLDSEILRS